MTELTLSQKRALAGSKGGKATVKKYGKRYMRKLARWAAHRMHSIYRLVPVDLNDIALVHRETGLVKAYLSGKPVEAAGRFLPVAEDAFEFDMEALCQSTAMMS
jgi:hypothetical protein